MRVRLPGLCLLIPAIGSAPSIEGAETDIPAPEGNDFLIIPGVRAGPVTRQWTAARIERAFGTLHCRREIRDFSKAEEGEEAGRPAYTVCLLYPATPDEIEIKLGAEDIHAGNDGPGAMVYPSLGSS